MRPFEVQAQPAASSPPPLPPRSLPDYLWDDYSDGGYPTELFDAKELEPHPDFLCSICASVCRRVVSCPSACAALFCSCCLIGWFERGGSDCPKCRRKSARDAFRLNNYVQKAA